MKKIAIFASGSGSNAENLINFFENSIYGANVTLVLTNNPLAGVIQKAHAKDVPVVVFSKQTWLKTDWVSEKLKTEEIDLVVLAGFMWLVPEAFVKAFENRIVNIHPALLPKFGGKGMYGHFVHEAVKAANESESGITIHWVNEQYDEGKVIFQAKTTLSDTDTAHDIEQKVRKLEIEHYPAVVQSLIQYI